MLRIITSVKGDHIRILISCLLLVFSILAELRAQNLAPNPGFELYTFCPAPTGSSLDPCPPWFSPPTGDSDYFNECAPPYTMSVPYNAQGFQNAHNGVAYTGAYYRVPGTPYREYVEGRLNHPLVAGECYKVGYYINLSNRSCGVNRLGALLTVNPINNPVGMTPQIDWTGMFFTDTSGWVFVHDYITALGGEEYITIGNFYGNAVTIFDPSCPPPVLWAYYYIDDVVVEISPTDSIAFDLGPPITACTSYTIDPELDEGSFYWSDGSHGSTLTVTTSGTYTLTLSYGCHHTESSVEVTIVSTPPVEIGTDSIVLCPGETYEISLDPDSGDYIWSDGTSGPDISISEEGIYQVSLDDGCDLTTDQIKVIYLEPPPSLSLGIDTFLCPGDELSFSFDPSFGHFEWQDNSNSSSYVITEAGTYSLTISNQCGISTDEIDVIKIDPPSFYLGPDTAFICEGGEIFLDFDPSIGNFYWQDGSTGSDYYINSEGLYSLSVTNECGIKTAKMFVEQLFQPIADMSASVTGCTGDTIILDPQAEDVLFLWQDGSSDSTFEVTSPGMYSVIISNACGVDTGIVVAEFDNPVILPSFGPDTTLCFGEEILLTVTSPGATYLWNDLTSADTLLITTPGNYFVAVSNQCGSLSDTINITADNMGPSLDLPEDFILCIGQSATLNGNVSGVSYLWSDSSQLSQLIVTSPGQYALTVSNNCGTASDTVMISDGGPAPMVSLGQDTSICAGQSLLITPVFTNVDTWLWQDSSLAPTYTVSTPGVISVEASNNCGVSYDTMLIDQLPDIPILMLGADTSFCAGNSITLSIPINNVNILWSNGSTSPEIIISDSALVSASISNVCGVSSDTIAISLLPEIPALDLGQDQNICPGETITISPAIPDVEYLWQNGSSDTLMNITQEGLITLSITNECGTSIDSILITESTDGPQIDLGPDTLVCEGEVVILSSNISGVNYLWQDGSVISTYTATSSGTYYLQVSNLCGSDSDTIEVNINGVAPSVDLGSDTTLCEGQPLILASQAEPMSTISWQDGSSTLTYSVQSAGIYSLIVTNRCGEATDSIEVNYMEAPGPFDLGADTTLCLGESILLTSPVGSFDILWQDGSILPQLLADQAKIYKLELRNDCGFQTDSILINIDDQAPLINLGPDTVMCQDDIIILDASQPFPARYLWNTGAETPSIQVSIPGFYFIDVSTPCMSATDDREISQKTDCNTEESSDDFYVPNIFSPNGDQFNNVFSIIPGSDVDLKSIEGSIYDRWGNQVFSSEKIPFIWDGKLKGERMLPGVYVYVLKIEYGVNGDIRKKIMRGDITLIR